MRILFFVHSLRRGGAERVLLEVALGLRAKGHVVEVVSWIDVDEYVEKSYSSVPRYFLTRKNDYRWPWSIPSAAIRLREIVGRFRPDVIEIHTPTVSWVAAWAGMDIPCVHVLHGYAGITRRDSIKGWWVRLVDRLVQRRLNAKFIVVAPPMSKAGAAHFAAVPSDFACVPNGVDLSKFHVRQKGFRNPPTILMLGTLSANKGQCWGVRAIGAMSEYIPDVRLKIVGEGAHRLALEALVKEMRLESNVEFMGTQEDVPELLSVAHVLWQLSESEGLPMVVLEAMAAGLPVIGFDVRGTRDAVVHGETGYLVPFGSVEAVVRSTVDLLRGNSPYEMLSLHARRRVERFFSLESMVAGHERILYGSQRS